MDHPLKVSFAMSGRRKRKASSLTPRYPEDDDTTVPGEALDHPSATNEGSALHFSVSNSRNCESLGKTAVSATQLVNRSPPRSSQVKRLGKITPLTQKQKVADSQPAVKSLHTMAEPPAKRTKRTDSSALWDRNSARGAEPEPEPKSRSNEDMDDRRDKRDRRDERNRQHGREDRRHRSRSRDVEKRRERSRSREKDKSGNKDSTRRRSRSRDRYRNRDRSDDRDRRDRKRSTSKERHRSRRGKFKGEPFLFLDCS